MPLDRNALEAALSAAFRDNFQRGKDEEWEIPQAADEMAIAIADAVHAYVTAAQVANVTSEVRDLANTVIGTGTQTGTVPLS
jgi:hypothetical protein